jgi:UDP-N-acetylglucosamine:LPS N-acetylglucosamine transferase
MPVYREQWMAATPQLPDRDASTGSPGERAEGSARLDMLLVCTTGGHLLQLVALRPVWQPRSRLWVTHENGDAVSILEHERVVYAYSPTTRNIPNLVRNLRLAWRVVARERPRIVLTTGAGVAVPFAWIARMRGARVVYVESVTRIEGLSLSARLVAPVAERLYVQWPELVGKHRRAEYRGNLLPTP